MTYGFFNEFEFGSAPWSRTVLRNTLIQCSVTRILQDVDVLDLETLVTSSGIL